MFKLNELLEATNGRLIWSKQNISLIKGISIDSRTIRSQEAFVAIKGNNFDGHDFIDEAMQKGANCIIIGKGYKKPQAKNIAFIEVKDTQRALGDIARFQRRKFNIPIIALTGSNGKTTAKEMIAWILSKRFKVLKNEGTKNNQIGLPLTLLNLNRHHDIAVLEIGTNQFGEVEYLTKICQPNIGIITNIGHAHLEYLHNLEGVFREKYTLIENLKKPYLAILNADDKLLKKQLNRKIIKPFILGFGIKNQTDFFVTDIKILNGKIEFCINPSLSVSKSNSKIIKGKVNLKYKFTLKTLGYYNIYNALAAIAVARIFGFGYENIASRLAAFDFPQSRLQLIKLNNINFLDDAYNSNPVSLNQALTVLDNFKIKGRKIFVMGDMLELGSREKLFHYQAGRKAGRICNVFITVGELSKLSAKSALMSGLDMKNIFICESSQEARDILLNKISPRESDIVLVKGSRLMKMEEIFRGR